MRILLLDDEVGLRRTLRMTLESMKHECLEVGTGEQAIASLQKNNFDIAFVDLRLGNSSGLDWIPKLLQISPQLGIIVMTAYAGIDSAVEAMRRGAFDYLPKPFTPDQLRMIIDRRQQITGLSCEVDELREQLKQYLPEADLTSKDPRMQQILGMAWEVAPTEATVLIRGESGTGKGILARAIHQQSKRKHRHFVTIHCPSLSTELLESELFGHTRGAFTGAIQSTEGKVAAADGGTLFLDEIGDLPLAMQPKLLRFLQDKTYERLGDTQTRTGNVRIIAATNRSLEGEVAAGRFREDLFYRLNVFELQLPPLRERRQDLLTLAEHLLPFFSRQSGKEIKGFTPESEQFLLRYHWPGNIRELRNIIERGVILTKDSLIGVHALPTQLTTATVDSSGQPIPALGEGIRLGSPISLEELENEHIRQILAHNHSLEEAAKILGIDASTLYRKRKKLGLANV